MQRNEPSHHKPTAAREIKKSAITLKLLYTKENIATCYELKFLRIPSY